MDVAHGAAYPVTTTGAVLGRYLRAPLRAGPSGLITLVRPRFLLPPSPRRLETKKQLKDVGIQLASQEVGEARPRPRPLAQPNPVKRIGKCQPAGEPPPLRHLLLPSRAGTVLLHPRPGLAKPNLCQQQPAGAGSALLNHRARARARVQIPGALSPDRVMAGRIRSCAASIRVT
jgi:hypothetical protein